MKLCFTLALAGAMIVALSSCAFMKAVSLPEARGRPGGKVELTLYGIPAPNEAQGATDATDDLPSGLQRVCGCPPRPEGCPETPLGPAAGILAVAAFSLVFAEATSALAAYVKAKQKRFTPTPYFARANVPAFWFLPEEGSQTFALRCVRLRRTLELEGEEPRTASDILVSFERPRYGKQYGPTGMIAVLRYIKLGDIPVDAGEAEPVPFAASTRAHRSVEEQNVKATVSIAFSILEDMKRVSTFDQSFAPVLVKQGADVELPDYENASQDNMSNQTAIMPAPNGQPATVVMTVGETGEGVEEFASFDEGQFRASASIITQALGNVIKLNILPNQPAP
jgi:hypothetical protein